MLGARCPFYQHKVTLIPAYTINCLSIPKLQMLHHWGLEMCKLLHPALYNGCYYLPMLWLKLSHISKSSPVGLICHKSYRRVYVLMHMQWHSSVRRLRTALVMKITKCFWRLLIRNIFFSNPPYLRIQDINILWWNTVCYEDHCKLHIGTRNAIHPRLRFYHMVHTTVARVVDCANDLFRHPEKNTDPALGK